MPHNLTNEEIISKIRDIIQNEIYLRDVPFSMQDGDMEVDPDSLDDAANGVFKMLNENDIC